MMFWGNKDTSVSFCEDKYTKSKYIAEYYNTFSGISYCLVGYYFFNKQITDIGIILYLLGVGTCLLHATQRYYGQWLDECSMLTLCFFIIKRIRKKKRQNTSMSILGAILFSYFYFENFFCYFLFLFVGLLVYIYFIAKEIERNKKYFDIYLKVLIFSSVCWLLDQLLCSYVKDYYLHALWHIGTSVSIFFGINSIL